MQLHNACAACRFGMSQTARDGHHNQALHTSTATTSLEDAPAPPPASAALESLGPMTASEALHRSFRVGLSGGGATVFSVVTMMWLHTIITYQQRHGTSFRQTCKDLWKVDGPRRFYRGVLPSLVSAPLCRFGDTLSNELAMIWFNGQRARAEERRRGGGERGFPATPVWVATFLGSLGAAAFHAVVVPLDTYKVRWCIVGAACCMATRPRQ